MWHIMIMIMNSLREFIGSQTADATLEAAIVKAVYAVVSSIPRVLSL